MSDPEYATWLTKQQAADRLGVSTKTVEVFAKEKKLEQAVWRPQGRGMPRVVYHPDDVDRMAAERRGEAVPFVLPAGPPGNGNGHATLARSTAPPADLDVRRALAAGLTEFAAALRSLSSESSQSSQSSQRSETSQTPTLYLTIAEASAFAGLSQAYLRRKCQAGWTGAIKDGAWKIRRKDLEAL